MFFYNAYKEMKSGIIQFNYFVLFINKLLTQTRVLLDICR